MFHVEGTEIYNLILFRLWWGLGLSCALNSQFLGDLISNTCCSIIVFNLLGLALMLAIAIIIKSKKQKLDNYSF